MNKNHVQTNVQSQSDYLREQSERAYREMKERYALDVKMRERQIAADLTAGFDKRADALQKELQEKNRGNTPNDDANAKRIQCKTSSINSKIDGDETHHSTRTGGEKTSRATKFIINSVSQLSG